MKRWVTASECHHTLFRPCRSLRISFGSCLAASWRERASRATRRLSPRTKSLATNPPTHQPTDRPTQTMSDPPWHAVQLKQTPWHPRHPLRKKPPWHPSHQRHKKPRRRRRPTPRRLQRLGSTVCIPQREKPSLTGSWPCSAGRPPEQSPAEQDLLLTPLDQTDPVRTTSNSVPGELTFCLDPLPADVQTVLPAS